jgi:hypothetical protein
MKAHHRVQKSLPLVSILMTIVMIETIHINNIINIDKHNANNIPQM